MRCFIALQIFDLLRAVKEQKLSQRIFSQIIFWKQLGTNNYLFSYLLYLFFNWFYMTSTFCNYLQPNNLILKNYEQTSAQCCLCISVHIISIFIQWTCPNVSTSEKPTKWNVVENLVFIMFNKKFCPKAVSLLLPSLLQNRFLFWKQQTKRLPATKLLKALALCKIVTNSFLIQGQPSFVAALRMYFF